MNAIENRMVVDHAWPKPQAATFEDMVDSLSVDAMYHEFEWIDDLTTEDFKEIVSEVTHAAWRGDYKSERERLDAIKASLLSFIEPWAEEMARD